MKAPSQEVSKFHEDLGLIKKAPGYCSLWVHNLSVSGSCNCWVPQIIYTLGTRNYTRFWISLAIHISSLIMQLLERSCVSVISSQCCYEIRKAQMWVLSTALAVGVPEPQRCCCRIDCLKLRCRFCLTTAYLKILT